MSSEEYEKAADAAGWLQQDDGSWMRLAGDREAGTEPFGNGRRALRVASAKEACERDIPGGFRPASQFMRLRQMNVERIEAVCKAIELACLPDSTPPLGFNMAAFHEDTGVVCGGDLTGHNCGSVACFAGWTDFLFPNEDGGLGLTSAKNTLGLTREQGRELFTPVYFDTRPEKYPPHRVVAVARHLAKTGTVDWSIGAPQSEEIV